MDCIGLVEIRLMGRQTAGNVDLMKSEGWPAQLRLHTAGFRGQIDYLYLDWLSCRTMFQSSFAIKTHEILESISIQLIRTIPEQMCFSSLFFLQFFRSLTQQQVVAHPLKRLQPFFSRQNIVTTTVDSHDGTLARGRLKQIRAVMMDR